MPPPYRRILEAHGREQLQPKFNLISKQGRWSDMGNSIGDGILNTFAVAGGPNKIVPLTKERYSSLVDCITINFNYAPIEQPVPLMKALFQS